MTIESQPLQKNKGGRPFGSFGPRKRQLTLVDEYIRALGGKVTPLQESDICRAVLLGSIAEKQRHEIDANGGTAEEITALARLEAVADNAVKRLRIPVTKINTGKKSSSL